MSTDSTQSALTLTNSLTPSTPITSTSSPPTKSPLTKGVYSPYDIQPFDQSLTSLSNSTIQAYDATGTDTDSYTPMTITSKERKKQ